MTVENKHKRDISVIIDQEQTKKFRLLLQNDGYFDKTKNITKITKWKAALPVKLDFLNLFDRHSGDSESLNELDGKVKDGLGATSGIFSSTWIYKGFLFTFAHIDLGKNKKSLIQPKNILWQNILQLLYEIGVREETMVEWKKALEEELPKSWEKHGSLVMLPPKSFTSNQWDNLGTKLWSTVAESLKVRKVARKSVVSNDGHRTPKVTLLHGEDGWVEQRDNNVRYVYDVTKCMFSAGNITEKLRIANWNCTGKTVVDLYAGIGYFSLPYLVHAKASYVHACEWNPDAVIALRKTLQLNGVSDRCTIYEGDNRQVCPRGVADCVNLGLIPSSEEGWPVACWALKPHTGGTMHIHANVTSAVRTQSHTTEETGSATIDNRINREPQSHVDLDNVECNVAIGRIDCKDITDHSVHTKSVSGYQCHPQTDQSHFQGHQTTACSNSANVVTTELRPKFSKRVKVKKEWSVWAKATSLKIKEMLMDIHQSRWTTEVIHIEHVKSYAPHVDHIVLDLMCKPDKLSNVEIVTS